MAFSLKARLKSFTYAFAGFVFMPRTQHNAWMHLAATVFVSPQFHKSVKRSKDIAAAAVLVCVIAASLLGVITLAPYVAAALR